MLSEDTTQTEQWKEVPGCPGYDVSDCGNLRSWWVRGQSRRALAPRPIKPKQHPQGYLLANFKRGRRKFLLHRLVLMAFVGPCPREGWHAAHSNGKCNDNRLQNLRWASPSENNRDKFAHGTALIGSRNHKAKLTPEQVSTIRACSDPKQLKSLASLFGVLPITVRRVASGLAWRSAHA